MTFGLRIRELRKKMKLTQAKLASLAKVSQATISDYERNVTTKHRADELMRIAAVLQTTPEYLLDGTGPENIKDATSDQEALIDTFNQLNQNSRAALIAAAKAMAITQK
jgi:transcriptional regulator with XRE-family HTH domain